MRPVESFSDAAEERQGDGTRLQLLIKKKVHRLEIQITEGENHQASRNEYRMKHDILFIK